jgi:hypothetical protein
MSRSTNARVAGFTFLFYIGIGIASMIIFGRATAGADITSRLLAIAQHATALRLTVLLALLQAFSAVVLAVTLYSITREQDRDIAMLAMTCRVIEGITAIFTPRTLGLLWLASNAVDNGPHRGATEILAGFLLRMGAWDPGAIFFAVGSTLFSWLLLRGRMIPIALAWLGVFASVLLVVVLPLELTGLLGRRAPFPVWLPMLVFEVVLAIWFLAKGVSAPAAIDLQQRRER